MSENQNIEWKENWRDEYLKWICGFANAAGGKIYIGTDDNGKVVGVADAKKLLEDIPNKVRDVLGIMVDVNLLEENGLQYIEIDVPPYSNPINYKGQYHYRSGSTKQELKGAALNRFIMQKTGRHWDEFPIERVKAEELSENALNRFRKEATKSGRVDEGVLSDTTGHLLQDLRLIDDAGHLPENWTTERLFESHPSSPYNPLIANAFFRSGDIESWGRGYKRILEAASAYKLLPPKLEMISGLMITYYTDVRSQLLAQRVDERYIPVIEYAAQNGSVTNSDVQRILNTNRTTAYRLLQQMGTWLEMHGVTGKSTYYTIKGLPNASQTLQK